MFEELKQRRVGRSAKESTRLWTTVAAALLCGSIVFTSRSCGEAVDPAAEVPGTGSATKPADLRPLDTKPLERLRTAPPPPESFDVEALGHVLREIRSGAVQRASDARLDISEVLALDPARAVGTLIETVGTVADLDAEVFSSPTNPTLDQLWGFALESETAAPGSVPPRVLVVYASNTTDAEGGKPFDASRASGAREPLAAGMRVRVRGVWLQQRTGSVGGVKGVDVPTPVLVLREARITYPELPGIPSPDQATFETMRDRTLDETKSVNDAAVYEILLWARKQGAKKLAEDLRSGKLPHVFWGGTTLVKWGREIELDTRDPDKPDPRVITLGARGRVIETTGMLVQQDHEDWESVPRNLYGVDDRWKYWIVSDFYANAMMLLDSPFPLSDFPGVRAPRTGRYQRVRVFGIYVKPYSYEPAGAWRRKDKQGDAKFATMPYFILLHMESDEGNFVRRPLWQNPFFWTGISLVVFLGAFFLIMSRLEKKEQAALHAQRVRINRKMRGAPPLADAGALSEGKGSTAGGAGTADRDPPSDASG